MSTIYRLHLAETPKGNLKYGWLRSLIGPPSFLDLERESFKIPASRRNLTGRTIFKSSTLIKTKSGATSRPPGPI